MLSRLPSSPLWLTTSRLHARHLSQWWALKLAKIFYFATGIAAILSLIVVRSIDTELASFTFLQGLLWLSWVLILMGFACAGDRRTLRELDGLRSLGQLRGLSASGQAKAELLGTLRTLLGPGLALGGALALTHCALAENLSQAARRFLQLPLTLIYFGMLAGLLALLASYFGSRAGRHARVLFAASVLVPYLASTLWPTCPSIPGVFGWILSNIVLRGGS